MMLRLSVVFYTHQMFNQARILRNSPDKRVLCIPWFSRQDGQGNHCGEFCLTSPKIFKSAGRNIYKRIIRDRYASQPLCCGLQLNDVTFWRYRLLQQKYRTLQCLAGD